MNTKDVSYLLQHPDKLVSPIQIRQLEEVLEEYPYFQAARSLHLKGLKNLNSFKYNNALKVVAAYTADREVLFDFITSKDFIQNTIADHLLGDATALVDNAVKSEEVVPQPLEEIEVDTIEEDSFPLTRAEADTLLDPLLFKAKDSNQSKPTSDARKTASDELDIGEPLPFTKKERYSFGEWLQLTAFKPLKENKKASTEKELEDINFPLEEENSLEEDSDKQKKFDLIDKFIADRPKINPLKDVPKIAISTSVKLDKKELMTETLAKVYLEQKKYKNAIQAYKILSLKYPEKSGFFADRIKAVERLKADDN
ncbi:hypothetical protein LCGC14_1772640 [marine sediment metagenome]|uniref:Tetratricopeptide repeat-containing protein n=2 Tax=root TaxID=1 RepID=A0A831VU39_9FLAO|nr:hypothetical protein [Pricia antarctica]